MKFQFLFFIFLACAVNPAFAETAEEPIIVTAARVALPVSQVTAAHTVISSEELLARGDQFVADALRRVPGLAVNRSGPTGALTQVRLRGSEANHLLVLIDGMQAGDPFTGSFSFANASASGVQSIEILRGEQSAIWGTDAIGGVIQILTAPKQQGNSYGAQAEIGSLQSRSGSVHAAQVKGDQRFWINISGSQTQGYDVSGNAGERDGYSQISGFAGADIPLSQNWALQLRGRAQSATSEFDSDSDFDGRLNDTLDELETDLLLGRIALKGTSHQNLLAHEVSASHLDSRTVSGSSRSVGSRSRLGWQTTGNWQHANIDHRLTGLLEGRFEAYENNGGAGAGQNQKQTANSYAGALDYQAVRGPFVLSLSGRHEENDLFANSNALRAGLAWNFVNLDGKLHASAGQGVKNPGFFELFGFFPAFFVGNPSLSAERSTGFELGWEQQFAIGAASITLFTSELENEVFTDFGVFPATARNRAGTSERQGVELAGDINLTENFHASGSMSFLRTEENGVPEIRRPDFLASLSLFWSDPMDPWQASLGIDHNGSMTDTDFASFQTVTLSSYTLVRAKISRKITDNLRVYLRGENIGNATYQEVVGFLGQERTIYAGLSAQF